MKSKILIAIIFALSFIPCFAQTPTSREQKSNEPQIIKLNPSSLISDEEKQEQEAAKPMDNEASYYAPIRYVIVYNWIFDLEERRMDVLIDAKQFDKKNLTAIFELIKKRFPIPLRLAINVHTSLATVETPEENEMVRDGEDSRFGHTYTKYKKAFYIRFEDGRESFSYTTRLKPFYSEKDVLLKSPKVK